MGKRRQGSRSIGQTPVYTTLNKANPDGQELPGDSEDEFHDQRDSILLDLSESRRTLPTEDQDEMEDEAVLDLESSFEDDEEHSEDERLLSSLRQSLGPQTDGAFGESDDDGGSGHGPKLKGDKEVEGDDADTRWGSSKAAYYNGEESSEDDQDQDEELEALRIQRKLAAQMSEADFEDEHFEDSFETLQKGGSAQSLQNKQKRQRSEDQKDLDSDNVVAIEHNLSALSEIERGKLVKRHCSDVLAGIEQLKDCLLEISSHETQELSSLRLLLASLLQFYLCQRASAPQKKLECHPIHNVLGRASLLIQEWSIVGTPVGIVDDKELPVSVNEKKKTLHVTEISNTLEERSQTSHENTAADSDADDGDLVYYESLLQNTRQRKTDREEAVQRMRQDIQESNRALADEDLLPEGEKRKATWKILANKGLTPHRKKENRNPRVKKRLRYEKALKKLSSFRRVAVDKTRVGAYQGESTGIKRDLSRSVRL